MKKSHCNSQQHCGRKTTNWFFGETPSYRGPVHEEPLNRPPAPKRMYINKLFLSLEEGKAPRGALPEAYVPAQPPCETPWAWLQINLVIACLSWLEISAERVALIFPCLVVLCLLAPALLHGLFSLTDISQKQSEMKKVVGSAHPEVTRSSVTSQGRNLQSEEQERGWLLIPLAAFSS